MRLHSRALFAKPMLKVNKPLLKTFGDVAKYSKTCHQIFFLVTSNFPGGK
jgi:hypothetical protein